MDIVNAEKFPTKYTLELRNLTKKLKIAYCRLVICSKHRKFRKKSTGIYRISNGQQYLMKNFHLAWKERNLAGSVARLDKMKKTLPQWKMEIPFSLITENFGSGRKAIYAHLYMHVFTYVSTCMYAYATVQSIYGTYTYIQFPLVNSQNPFQFLYNRSWKFP